MIKAVDNHTSPIILGDSQSTATIEFVIKSILNESRFNALIEQAGRAVTDKNSSSDPLLVAKTLQSYIRDCGQTESNPVKIKLLSKAALHIEQFLLKQTQEAAAPDANGGFSNQTWRSPQVNQGRALADGLPHLPSIPLISRTTPIGAAGSCFATEITHYLRSHDFNYVVTEENENSCAAWGGLYNTPSFRQLVEVAFGLKKRPSLLFECEDTGKKEYWDPFREGVFFSTVEEFEESTRKHIEAAKAALMQTKVFIMTVGLNEIWRLSYDHSVLARYPRTVASHLVYNQILTVEENLRELQRMLDVWRTYNPELRIIITVSPVPLYATFRAEDSHVIASTCHSKSVLRLAVEQFVEQNPGVVFYFPAFEVVSYCSPEPWTEDCRHVTRDTVQLVMSLFEKTFLY